MFFLQSNGLTFTVKFTVNDETVTIHDCPDLIEGFYKSIGGPYDQSSIMYKSTFYEFLKWLRDREE